MLENNKDNLENIIYPDLEKVVISKSASTKNIVSDEPIYFDYNILCCPYCGNKKLHKSGINKGKRILLCLRKDCNTRFTHPKDRKRPPGKKPGKMKQFFDSHS